MEPVKFYEELPSMFCYAGDTLPEFEISVTGMADLNGCRMVLLAEEVQGFPGAVALTKECTLSGDHFTVQLTSDDTTGLHGVYRLHFVLTDADGAVYKKLTGTLTVHRSVGGGNT